MSHALWGRGARALRRAAGSPVAFCLCLSALLVLTRVLIYDAAILRAEVVPNHDMSQGLGHFATNMHSMRLDGEPAWWNPLTNNGYAQYHQAFLSPLAPTPHHLTFVVWGRVVRGLALAGVRLPEYEQYL